MDVAGLVYKPGWRFRLGGPGDRYLCVYAHTPDSWAPRRMRFTQHQFPIPAEGITERWLFDRLMEIEQHECAEFLTIDGKRPFYPNHGDEGSPYALVDRST
jgi:hypothetical protein